MAVTENIKNLVEATEKDAELRAKFEALAGEDDAIKKAVGIANECGFTLTEEDFAALTEEDFKEDKKDENATLSLDELDSVAGGVPDGLRLFVREMNFRRMFRAR